MFPGLAYNVSGIGLVTEPKAKLKHETNFLLK